MTEQQARFRKVDVDHRKFPDLGVVSEYWLRKKQESGRFAPSWRDVELFDLPSRLIPRICVVDVLPDDGPPDGPDFRYRFWGTGVTNLHSYDLTGKSVLDLVPAYYARCIWQQYCAVLEARQPIGFLTEVPKPNGVFTYYAAVRFPLSSDGETVDLIMTAEDYGDERKPLKELFEEVWKVHEVGGVL